MLQLNNSKLFPDTMFNLPVLETLNPEHSLVLLAPCSELMLSLCPVDFLWLSQIILATGVKSLTVLTV